MKTKIILLVGPSGAGKDLLLKYSKEIYGEKLNLVKRYITKESDVNESNFYIDEYAFEILRHNSYFASTWEAYGNYYGIPKRFINNGLNLIAVSRARIVDFENLYDNVYTINISIPKKDIIKRLENRGLKEDEIKTRLLRNYEELEARNIIEFDNSLPFELSKENFIGLLRQIENE